jgi:DNA-binding protein HU-beta
MPNKTKKDIKTYTKAEFIKLTANHCDMTQVDTEKALNAFIQSIIEVMQNGGKVTFVGFGSF